MQMIKREMPYNIEIITSRVYKQKTTFYEYVSHFIVLLFLKNNIMNNLCSFNIYRHVDYKGTHIKQENVRILLS